MLRALSNVIVKPLLISFERSQLLGKVPEDWKKATVIFILKKDKNEDLEHYRMDRLISVPGKVMKQTVLETISNMKDKKVTGRIYKEKSCLTILIAFYDEMIGLVDMGRAVDAVYLDFSKSFDTFI